MGRRLAVLAGVALLGAGCVRPRHNAARRRPRRYECRRARGTITIDGYIDERAWGEAQVIEDFRVPGTGRKPAMVTGARLLWDDEFLYVAVTLGDRDVYAVKKEHDANLWEDDVAEVFLKPSEANDVYYEFHVNAIGTTFDARFARRGAGHLDRWKPWESGMKGAASVKGTANNWRDKDKGWLAEMAIPLKAFKDATSGTAVGDRWRVAICRYNYSVYLPAPGLATSAPLTTADFHRHEEYDTIEFTE